jgi:hypothetical protein
LRARSDGEGLFSLSFSSPVLSEFGSFFSNALRGDAERSNQHGESGPIRENAVSQPRPE